MNQLELDVLTLQPTEAYLLYAEVSESWDSWQEEDRGEEYDGCTFGPARYNYHLTRTEIDAKILQGVIVDDGTLEIIKGRMEKHAREWEEKAISINAGSTDKPNFKIAVVYTLEKIKKIIL